MKPISATTCPDDETLAAFVDGRVSIAERNLIVEHLDRCRTCVGVVAAVVRHLSDATVVDAFVRSTTTRN